MEVNWVLDFLLGGRQGVAGHLVYRAEERPYFAMVQRIFQPARNVPRRFPEILDWPAILWR